MDIAKNRYREVLTALEGGPKSSDQIQREVGFTDIDHTAAIIAKLSSHRYVARVYVITEEGKKALHQETDLTNQAPRREAPKEATVTFSTSSTKKPFSIKLVGGLPSVVKEND